MKVLIVSDLSIYALANSFIRALEKEGHEVKGFDIHKSIRKNIRLGKFGQKLHSFWPVETWNRKGNRELAVFFMHYQPDKVIVFGNSPVLYSTLAFWKSISNKEIFLF